MTCPSPELLSKVNYGGGEFVSSDYIINIFSFAVPYPFKINRSLMDHVLH